MQQIVQDKGRGRLRIVDVPAPIATPGRVVIANAASVLSVGTERTGRQLAQESLLQKARQRPDQLWRALLQLRDEGLREAVGRIQRTLDEWMSLGYSAAGTVLACGDGVQGIRPGDRVASNGPHASVVSVPRNLCATVPESVPLEHAAFAMLGAIALQAVRLTEVRLGESALVIGLGPLGQISVALLRAAGCRVLATDPDASRCQTAERMGAHWTSPEAHASDILALGNGLGVDAVLIAAATPSAAPVTLAGEVVRRKGRVVILGDVGMNVPRTPYFLKEATLVVSCSAGPGRYDEGYEERGIDYPAAYVRWTEQRNLQAVLDLMASGALNPAPLITHRFDIQDAAEAYDLIEKKAEPHLGIVLRYPGAESEPTERRVLALRHEPARGLVGVGCIGAGAFARQVLLPALAGMAGERRLVPEVRLLGPGTLGHGRRSAVWLRARHER